LLAAYDLNCSQEERASAISLASKMVQAAKFQATMVSHWFSYVKLDYHSNVLVSVQARLYEGKEPVQFFVILQSLQVLKVVSDKPTFLDI
jgi:hypothetical protein